MQFQPIDSKAITAGQGPNREPLNDLSLMGHFLLPVAIFTVALVTIDLSHHSNFVTTLWPPNAIILVALLRHARTLRNYGSILAGGALALYLANLASGNSLTQSAILSTANLVDILMVWALLSAAGIGASNLTSFRNLLIFIVIAGTLSSLESAAFAARTISTAHGIAWHLFLLNSYPAHALGMIVVTPLLICITAGDWNAQRIKQRFREAAAIFALIAVIGFCAAYFRSVIFIIVPVILLATIRFGMLGATVSTLMIAAIFTSFLVMGIGQPLISHAEVSDRILALQILIAFSSLWSLPVAALLTERDRLLTNLSLANTQLQVESERKSHMVMGLHRHLSTAEEKERLRLSHELHDQAGQSLIAAILELSEIDPLIEQASRQRLHQVRRRMEDMGKTLHRIAWELRPPSIDEVGLCKALASYVEDWGEQCDTAVDFHSDGSSLDEVPYEIGSAVYRVVQEALTNVVKHARKPASVSVVMRRVNTALQVIIEDNGCGFDVGATAATGGHSRGLGLDGMRERLLLIGGTLEIESAAGAGTTIFARIPLDSQRSAA